MQNLCLHLTYEFFRHTELKTSTNSCANDAGADFPPPGCSFKVDPQAPAILLSQFNNEFEHAEVHKVVSCEDERKIGLPKTGAPSRASAAESRLASQVTCWLRTAMQVEEMPSTAEMFRG